MNENPLYLTSLQILENPDIKAENTVLYDFHKKMEIKSLSDVFGVTSLSHIPYDCLFLPWLHYEPVGTYRDVAFVDFDATNKVKKLKGLVKSMKENGYNPKKYPDRKGGITGYYLSKGDLKRLYVVSGNHRSAVLAALGMEIEFKFEDGKSAKSRDIVGVGVDYTRFPEAFSGEEVASWPSVKSGFITAPAALEILERYLNA